MKTYEIHSRTGHAQPAAVMTATLPVAEIGPWLAKTYGTLASIITAGGAYPAGPPFARYHRLGEDRFAVEAGFPVSTPIDADGDVRPSQLPGGPLAVTVHTAPMSRWPPRTKRSPPGSAATAANLPETRWRSTSVTRPASPIPPPGAPRSSSPTARCEHQAPGNTGSSW